MKKKEAGRRKKGEKKQDRSRGSERKTEGKREKEKQSKCDAGNRARCIAPSGTAQPVAPTWAGTFSGILCWHFISVTIISYRR